MKICVIGNSHLAALKLAVVNGALDGTGADIVFFGVPGRRFKKIGVRDGVICGPDTLRHIILQVSEGQYTEINPAEFDVVIVYAGSFRLHQLIGSIHHAQGNQVHLSEKCLAIGIKRWLTSTHVFRLGYKIGKASTTTRVILVPRPIPAAGATAQPESVDRNRENQWIWDRLEPAFRKKIWNICRQSAERRGVELFLQPETTIDANQFTKPEFTTHSTRLLKPEVAHEQADVVHMNAKFGEVFLLSLLDHLSKTDKHAQRLPDAASA